MMPSFAASSGSSACDSRIGAVRFTVMDSSQSAIVTALVFAKRWTAALFTKAMIGLSSAAFLIWAMQRSEEHTSELQSLMRISYAAFCLKKKKNNYESQLRMRIQSKLNPHKH